jgi:hypothetical protein
LFCPKRRRDRAAVTGAHEQALPPQPHAAGTAATSTPRLATSMPKQVSLHRFVTFDALLQRMPRARRGNMQALTPIAQMHEPCPVTRFELASPDPYGIHRLRTGNAQPIMKRGYWAPFPSTKASP